MCMCVCVLGSNHDDDDDDDDGVRTSSALLVCFMSFSSAHFFFSPSSTTTTTTMLPATLYTLLTQQKLRSHELPGMEKQQCAACFFLFSFSRIHIRALALSQRRGKKSATNIFEMTETEGKTSMVCFSLSLSLQHNHIWVIESND